MYLSAFAVGDEPPTEFRIFKSGPNESTKGTFLFDDEAARLVMAEYQRHGVDLIVDLEHDSLDEEARKMRADAANALAHFQLEVRNGELWAVNVSWNEDGATRLRKKTQRYLSPAFLTEKETGRIVELWNVALCSMPATRQAVPLVAASRLASDRESVELRVLRYCAKVGLSATDMLARLKRSATGDK